jgi:hypothetical protein
LLVEEPQLKKNVHTTLDKYMLKYNGGLSQSYNLSTIDKQIVINSISEGNINNQCTNKSIL